MRRIVRGLLAGVSLVAVGAVGAGATEGGTWQDLSAEIYGDALLTPAGDMIVIEAPYRTPNDARTNISAQVEAPPNAMLRRVTLIIDENPMPVSAVFDLERPLPAFFFDATMRINGPTPVHVVAETVEGQLLVAETFVKTSGLGACSAPPGTDPEIALETLGEMTIGISDLQAAGSVKETLLAAANPGGGRKRLDVGISHPSHSGMQMDQISLLFIPMRYVERVEIDLDGQGFVDVTGSISLSENPELSLSVPGETGTVDVTMTDTDGTVAHASRAVAGF